MTDSSEIQASPSQDLIAEIVDEFTDRLNRGEQPEIEEYARKHEEIAGNLRQVLQPLLAMRRRAVDIHPPTEKSPETLGDYCIVHEIGRGGMAVVYAATHQLLRRPVALKVLPESLAKDTFVQRFEREARAAANLHHTHIVPIYETGVSNGRHFIAMQYIAGRSLDKVIKERARQPRKSAPEQNAATVDFDRQGSPDATGSFHPSDGSTDLEPPEVEALVGENISEQKFDKIKQLCTASDREYFLAVARMGTQAAEGLAYAHNRGVLHRDIKPGNLLLDGNTDVWISDFGLAKTEDDDLTNTGDIVGTLRYMAPERFQGKCDARSDVYALGVTLYEMLWLRPVFVDNDQLRLIKRVTDTEPVHLKKLNHAIPLDLATIVHKAMAKRPADRYASAAAFAEDLGRFRAGRPIAARRVGLAEQLWRWSRRHPTRAGLLLATTVALLALLAVGVGIIYYQNEQSHFRALAAVRKTQIERDMKRALKEAFQLRTVVLEQQKQSDTALALHNDPERWEGRLKRALSLVEGAEALGQTSGLDLDEALLAQITSLKSALQSDESDRQQARRLEKIRLETFSFNDKSFDTKKVSPRYAEEFRTAGLDVAGAAGASEEKLKELAARIRSSRIQWQWVAALDHWAEEAPKLGRRLLHLARLSDPDPAWRDRFRRMEVWFNLEALEELEAEPASLKQSPMLIASLAVRLHWQGGNPTQLLRKALLRHPGDFWLHHMHGLNAKDASEKIGAFQAALAIRPQEPESHNQLGMALRDQKRFEEAISCFRKAVDLEKNFVAGLSNLGSALNDAGRFDEAIAAHRKAIAIDPNLAGLYNNLGTAYKSKQNLKAAEKNYRKALKLDPRLSIAQGNLGDLFMMRKMYPQAVDWLRKAVESDPKYLEAHGIMGTILCDHLHEYDAAATAFHRVIELNPKDVAAYDRLGSVCKAQKKLKEAEVWHRKAIKIDPKYTQAHYNLGNIMHAQQKLEEATACFRQVIEIDPKHAKAHYNLANMLRAQHKLEEATLSFRRAFEIDPNYPEPWCNLGLTLQQLGKFRESLAALRRGHELGSAKREWSYPSAQWIREAELFVALDKKLPDVLRGAVSPTPVARLKLAELCYYKKKYATAATFFAEAFAADRKFAVSLHPPYRYNAACAAALAAAGKGIDQLTDEQRTTWRKKAFGWLTDELTDWKTVAQKRPKLRPAIAIRVKKWLDSRVFAAVRDSGALAKLPPKEQAPWRELWAEVAKLRQPALEKNVGSDK